MPAKDLTGYRSGRLVVVALARVEKRGVQIWECRCDCGKVTFVRRSNLLRSRPTKSCGCSHLQHGMTDSGTYKSWSNMISRCTCPGLKRAKDYIGRGITVANEWRDFGAFLRDMGERPVGCSLDRIDNDRGYSKDNCRWATPVQQLNNTRRNKFFELNGEQHTVAELARRFGLPVGTLRTRLDRGWSLIDALNRPVGGFGRAVNSVSAESRQ